MPYNNIHINLNITYCYKIRIRCISEIRIKKWFSLSIGMKFIKRKDHLKALSCLSQGKMYSLCKHYYLHMKITLARVSGNSEKLCQFARYSSVLISHDLTLPTLAWRNVGIGEVKNKSVAQWIHTTFPTYRPGLRQSFWNFEPPPSYPTQPWISALEQVWLISMVKRSGSLYF